MWDFSVQLVTTFTRTSEARFNDPPVALGVRESEGATAYLCICKVDKRDMEAIGSLVGSWNRLGIFGK